MTVIEKGWKISQFIWVTVRLKWSNSLKQGKGSNTRGRDHFEGRHMSKKGCRILKRRNFLHKIEQISQK